MRVSFIAAFIALSAPLFAVAKPVAEPTLEVLDLPVTYSNISERTYYQSSWTSLKCDRIEGRLGNGIFSVYYDFGCLCLDDVDSFCRVNRHSDYVNQWIRWKFQSLNTKIYSYPTGSQPTCDDQGGYTCPNGRKGDKTCNDKAAQCGDGQTLQSDGSCCPRGTKKVNGLCCAQTCSGTYNGKCYGAGTCADGKVLNNELCCQKNWTGYDTVCCPPGQEEDDNKPGTCKCTDTTMKVDASGTCVARCKTDETWFGTKCCPKYLTLKGDTCVCSDDSFYNDAASKTCKPSCNSQEQWDVSSKKCLPKCGPNFTWSFSTKNAAGLCCTSGTVCKTKVCCKPEEVEVGDGKCCPAGNTWNANTKGCQAPSAAPTATRKARRNLAARKLNAADKARLRINEKLCPKDLSACPVAPGSSGYECLDSFTDISSCGGCATIGEGRDCTAIKGAKWMGCEQGSCVVYSCRKGFKLVNGKECVKA